MRTTTFKGIPLELIGSPLELGQKLPSFTLTGLSMGDVNQAALQGTASVILTVPSLDTPVCSIEAKRFCNEVVSLPADKVRLLVVSRDLPFAQKRWCGAEGIEQPEGGIFILGSDYKHRSFGSATGTLIKDWDLLSRAVFVVDASGKFTYVEYVPELSEEPNYEEALAALKSCV